MMISLAEGIQDGNIILNSWWPLLLFNYLAVFVYYETTVKNCTVLFQMRHRKNLKPLHVYQINNFIYLCVYLAHTSGDTVDLS